MGQAMSTLDPHNLDQVCEALARIQTTAKLWGVSILTEVDTWESGALIHIIDLARHNSHEGSHRGDGMGVVRQVLHLADMFGYMVDIEYMADESALGELYGDAGFVEYDRGHVVNMRRMPSGR